MKFLLIIIMNCIFWSTAYSFTPSTCQISMMEHNLLEPLDPKYSLPPQHHKDYYERTQYHFNRGVLPEYGPTITLQNQPKNHPSVVLTHGFAESPAAMQKVAQKYREAGFNVINTLLPGHGHSKKDMIQSIIRMERTFVAWENELTLALQSARKIGNGKVVFHGFSMGGMIGVKVIQKSPDLANAAVVTSPMIKRSELMNKALFYVRRELHKWLQSGPQTSIDDFKERDLGNHKDIDSDNYFTKGVGYASRPIESDDFTLAFEKYIMRKNNYYFNSSPNIYVAYSEYDRIAATAKVKLFFNGDNAHFNIFQEKKEVKHNDLLRGKAEAKLTQDQVSWAANQINWQQ